MSLKYYLLLFLVIPIMLQSAQKDDLYKSRKNLKQAQRVLNLQKRNLSNMKKTLSLINEKNIILKELSKRQKEMLINTKNDLEKTRKSLEDEKVHLIGIQTTLNTKINTLKQQQELLDKKLKKISTAKQQLHNVNSKVQSKETQLITLRKSIEEQRLILLSKDEALHMKNIYILVAFVLLFIFVFIFIYMHKLRKKEKQTFLKLEELTKNLELKVIEGVERQKQLQDQKSSSMNEMIGNIAHQWRQPLNVISAVCTKLSIKLAINQKIDTELLASELSNINKNTQYLSETIDTFRDYVKGGKTCEKLVLQDELKQAFMIASNVLKDNYIESVDHIDYENPVSVMLVKSELPQVIINIINNAKDAIVQNEIQNPKIQYNLIKESDKVIITIEDNAGGIPEDIMTKIFEPYFTTKHKSKGTGLGLHMSFKIITQSLKGKIYVQNTDVGAKFFIELPLSI